MTDAEALRSNLIQAWSEPRVEEIAGDLLRVDLPDPRFPHQMTSLAIERIGDNWRISDDGHYAFFLGDDFEAVVVAAECAGASFRRDGENLIVETDDIESIAELAARFAADAASLPLLARSLACAQSTRVTSATPRVVLQMARQTRDRIVHHLPPIGLLVRVNHQLPGRFATRAPLAVTRPSGRGFPMLISSFVDLESSRQAVGAALRNSAWLFDVVADHPVPKFLIARGPLRDVRELAQRYDHENVTTLAESELKEFDRTIDELLPELAR